MSKLILILIIIFHLPSYAKNKVKIKYIQDELKTGKHAPKMVIIPEGKFTMGSPKSELGRSRYGDDEAQKKVSINSFAISETEVTFSDYDYYAKLNLKALPKDYHGRKNMPVTGLSYVKASDYAKWLSEQTGYYYRLPTEAEWEYAARAWTNTPFHTGECINGSEANFDDRTKSKYGNCIPSNIYLKKPTVIASYPPNKFGVFDMHGNESEWVKDCKREYSLNLWEKQGLPWNGEYWDTCEKRIVKGGRYQHKAKLIRSATSMSGHNGGIRLVRELDRKSPYPIPRNILYKKTNKIYNSGDIFNDLLKSNSLAPTMIVIAEGYFIMGGSISEVNNSKYYKGAEQPKHKVKINKIAIGQTEITFNDYKKFTDATNFKLPNDNGWGKGNRPVINISWFEAKSYTHWLSKEAGFNYRLPSEAEWEYAARAGSQELFNHGECMTPKLANYNDLNIFSYKDCKSGRASIGKTMEVSSYPANSFGLYDVDGNVSEMLADCSHSNYINAPADGSVWLSDNKGNCQSRAIRGGSFAEGPYRFAKRSFFSIVNNNGASNVGFRVVRVLD